MDLGDDRPRAISDLRRSRQIGSDPGAHRCAPAFFRFDVQAPAVRLYDTFAD